MANWRLLSGKKLIDRTPSEECSYPRPTANSGRWAAVVLLVPIFAEFERGIIRERVNAGLARARAKGTKLGRRPVGSSVEVQIRELRLNGDPPYEMAQSQPSLPL